MKTFTPTPNVFGRFFALQILTAALAFSARAGVVLDLNYGPVTGTTVSDLTNFVDYPNNPVSATALTAGLREPVDFGNSYGAWTRGFIEAPQDGQYRFWIASDDDGQFFLSTDENPANKVLVCHNAGFVADQSFTDKPSQKSALITLQKGRKYYFEMLHKEDTGGDHCTIAWTLPDSTFVTPIPSRSLWPYAVDLTFPYPPLSKAPLILTDYLGTPVDNLPATISVEENRPVDMIVTVDATQPAYVQWFSNNVPIPGANLESYTIPAASLAQNGATYVMVVTNSLGSNGVSTTLTVNQDVTAPTLVDALNLGNPGGVIVVIFSESVDPVTGTNAANYALNNGATVTSARFGSSPNTVLLKTSGLAVGPAYIVTVSNVKDRAATPNTITPSSTINLEQSLNTWLRLDENTGLTMSDSSGNGRDGLLVNGAAPGYVGKVSRSVNFDAVNDHVRLQNGYSDFTAGLTVALWARPTTSLLWARFAEFGNAAASDNVLFARNGTSDAITFEVYQGGATSGKVTANSAITPNQWQHFVATMDSSGSTIIYKNGIPLVTNVTGIPNLVTRTNNFLGRSNWGGDGYYGGREDDFRLYNRVLGPDAVKALASGAGADDVDPTLPSVSVVATTPNTALLSTPPGVFTITRVGDTSTNLTVLYSLGGTATNGVAYTNLSGTATILNGSSSVQIFVQPINFSFAEAQQTVILNLTPDTNYNVGDPITDTVTIFNNNSPPTPILATARGNLVDVWFGAAVTTPTATNIAHFNFNPPQTVTAAALDSRSLRVVLTLAGTVPDGSTLTVTNVQNPGGTSVSNQLSVRMYLANVANLVASAYHSPNDRPSCLVLATNGIVDNVNEIPGFDTFNPDGTDFAGLQYYSSIELYAIKVDLGRQFGDGGSWNIQPKLFRLKIPADTSTGVPEENTNIWEQVLAPLISGSQFNGPADANPSPNTPIVFDLSGLAANQRTGYGWAVGGVTGDVNNTFISITELSGYGFPGANPPIQLATAPSNFNVPAGQRAKLEVFTTLQTATYQWQINGGDIAGETKRYFGIPPVTPLDNGSSYGVQVTVGGSPYTNMAATLAVIPRATAPVVRNATSDGTNIFVWFDEYVEPGSAQTVANYTVNDGALSLISAIQDAQGYRVSLAYSGIQSIPNLTLTVTNVGDMSGNVIGSQTVPVVGLSWPASRVIANAYQQGRAASLTRATNNIITYGDANSGISWTTFGSFTSTNDFVGLGYPEPQVFDTVEMYLGWQFGDGGDWSERPRVYLEKTTFDTAGMPPNGQMFPSADTNNWVEVPAVLMSGNIFDGSIAVPTGTTPLPNGVIAFDLRSLTPDQRTGWAWAIGGVKGNALPGTARFVDVSELRGFGQAASTFTNAGPPVIALDIVPRSYTKQSGSPLTLYTVVTGQQPLHYQWRHNGTNLTDTTRIFGANSNVLVIREFLAGDGGTYQMIVTNSLGSNFSTVATVALATGIANLNGGTNWTLNGGASISNGVLQLVNGINQARSAYLNDQYYIGSFRASFTYQDVGGGGADGSTFVLHNAAGGAAVTGGAGGNLGYATAVTPSVALCMNIYSNASGGIGYSFGANGGLGTPYKSTAPVNLASGDPIRVSGYYDGTVLYATFSNMVTTATFSTNVTISIPTVLLTNRAYVGFTSGAGSIPSNQRITDFQFTSLPPLTITPTNNTFVITWPTAVGNFVLQENTSVSSVGWVTLPAYIDFVNGRNQVIVPATSGNKFYRLLLQ